MSGWRVGAAMTCGAGGLFRAEAGCARASGKVVP